MCHILDLTNLNPVLGTWFICRRLHYFFISSSLRDNVNKAYMLTPFSTDQSPLTFSLVTIKEENIVNGL